MSTDLRNVMERISAEYYQLTTSERKVADYITDHQKSLGQAMGKPNGVVPTEELSDMLGWFTLPAMPDKGGDGAPAADDLRTLGGPDHHPLALVNRDAEKTELCIDFLKYLFSPQGFDEYYRHYKNLGKVCAMQCYLKAGEGVCTRSVI